MTTRSRDPGIAGLLDPGHVALVGASPKPGFRRLLLDNWERHGCGPRLSVVNPNYATVSGHPSYPTLGEVPGPVDAVCVAVGADLAIDVVSQARSLGIPLATVLASDFDDAGRPDRTAALREAAGDDLLLLGPGSLGFVNFHDNVVATWSGALGVPGLVPGGVALVTESGGLGGCVLERAQEEGLGLSYCVWTGAGLTSPPAAIAAALAASPRVSALALLIERPPSRAALHDLAAAGRAHGVPVCVTKIGRGGAAERAVLAHSGALAGDYSAFAAVCRQEGLLVCEDIDDLLALTLSSTRPPRELGRRPRVFALSGSGGATVVMADALEAAGCELAQPGGALRRRLAALLPPRAHIQNPLDLTAGYDDEAAAAVRREVLRSGRWDVLVEALTMVTGERAAARASAIADAAAGGTAVAVYWPAGALAAEGRRALLARGIYPFRSTGALTRVLAMWQEQARLRGQRSPAGAAAEPADLPLDDRPGDPRRTVEGILRQVGAGRPGGGVAGSVTGAVRLARRVGWPVVLKVLGQVHRSEEGGVVVDVRSERELREHWPALHALSPGGVEVQRFVEGDIELYVGWRLLAPYGAVLIVGMGGERVEVDPDVVQLACPVDAPRVLQALGSLRGAALFEPFRGRPGADLGPVATTIARLSRLAPALSASLPELEMNPVILRRDGSFSVVDMVVRVSQPSPQAGGPAAAGWTSVPVSTAP